MCMKKKKGKSEIFNALFSEIEEAFEGHETNIIPINKDIEILNKQSDQEINRSSDQVHKKNTPLFNPLKKPNDLNIEQFRINIFLSA